MAAPPPTGIMAGGTLTSAQVAERLVTRRAWVTVQADDVSAAASSVHEIVKQVEGIVSESSQGDDHRASFVLQVPAPQLEQTLDRLAALGRARDRRVTAQDVTDAVFDLEARLQNKRALRERLRMLLGSATAFQDVLAVEDQLARVQTDIDTLEGQIQRLRSQVALSQITLWLEPKTHLGPLGHLFRGLWSGLSWLFVW